jgi:hypothetical protein
MKKAKSTTPALPAVIEKENKAVLSTATDYKALTTADYEHGRDLLKTLTAATKKAKEQKDTVLKPLLEAVAARREEWRGLEEKLAICVAHIKGKMAKFLLEENVRQERERLRIANDNRIKNPETLEKKLSAVIAPPTTGTRNVLVLKITDPNAIPREYLTINETLLRADLKDGKVIPGAELVRDQIITA